jgi:hypothetical protein
MAKAKSTFNPGGYTDWGVRRTLREAENAARWSPWSAIQWMEEARDQISLENPLYDEFDRTATKINALWKSYERHSWYEAKVFWKKGTVSFPPQRIKLFDEGLEPTKPTSIHDFFKI